MIEKIVALRLTVECPHCGVTHPVYRFEDKTTCWSCEHSFALQPNQWQKWLAATRGNSQEADNSLRLPEAALVHPNGKALNRHQAGQFNITVTQGWRVSPKASAYATKSPCLGSRGCSPCPNRWPPWPPKPPTNQSRPKPRTTALPCTAKAAARACPCIRPKTGVLPARPATPRP